MILIIPNDTEISDILFVFCISFLCCVCNLPVIFFVYIDTLQFYKKIIDQCVF